MCIFGSSFLLFPIILFWALTHLLFFLLIFHLYCIMVFLLAPVIQDTDQRFLQYKNIQTASKSMIQSNLVFTSVKESACRRHKRCRFSPWVRKIPWSKKWQPTPVFLPGKFHGQRSLAGCSLWGHKESDTTERLCVYITMSQSFPPVYIKL